MSPPDPPPPRSSGHPAASAPSTGGSASSSHSAAAPAAFDLSRHESLTWAPSSTQTSHLRHLTDYERIRTLGRGAFGTTHLVRNVVDSRRYALKCIPLGSNGGNGGGELEVASKGVLREVEALSALRSENVVRYFGAWVERGELGGDDGSSVGCGEDVTDWTDASAPNTDGACTCTCNLCHGSYNDWEISYEQWGLIDSVLQPLNLCTECYLKSLPDSVDGSTIDIRQKRCEPDCLYILMEYAGHTLTEEMKRISESGDDADAMDANRWSIFAQCVQGLVHIQTGGFLHRDIKPGNIFFQDGVAKIGDLGLASNRIKPASLDADGTGSECVGTLLYSAPEDGNRNEKADIYSLGIVLVELFRSFATGMERVAVLSRIREGQIPSDWAPDTSHSELARQMTSIDPSQRPSAQQVLEFLIGRGLLANPDASVLTRIVAQLQEQVRGLQRMVRKKDIEIERLQKRLTSTDMHGQESEVERLRKLLSKSGVDAQEQEDDREMMQLRMHLPANGTATHANGSEADRLRKFLPNNGGSCVPESDIDKLRRLLPKDAINEPPQQDSEVDRMRKLLEESGVGTLD